MAVACTVLAKPRVTAMFWIIDANGTSVAEGDRIADHWTLDSVRCRVTMERLDSVYTRRSHETVQ